MDWRESHRNHREMGQTSSQQQGASGASEILARLKRPSHLEGVAAILPECAPEEDGPKGQDKYSGQIRLIPNQIWAESRAKMAIWVRQPYCGLWLEAWSCLRSGDGLQQWRQMAAFNILTGLAWALWEARRHLPVHGIQRCRGSAPCPLHTRQASATLLGTNLFWARQRGQQGAAECRPPREMQESLPFHLFLYLVF